MITVRPIPALQDNYIWMMQHDKESTVVVVDPGCADSVKNVLQDEQLSLEAILITHHHQDHTGGVAELLETFPSAAVYQPEGVTIHDTSKTVGHGDVVSFWHHSHVLNVIALPGHTLDHLGYYDDQRVFCGDTLFSSGCGRLFEGSYQQLFDSLELLADLPKETFVYCTHEYTLANLAFAEAVEPENRHIALKKTDVKAKRALNHPSLPSTIGNELETNPFLRASRPEVIAAASTFSGEKLTSPLTVFAALRRWKDQFVPKPQ